MSDTQAGSQPQELTPEARQVLKRARRAFFVSIALLIVGLFAIGGALIYRSSQSGGNPPSGADYVISALKLPKDAEVISAVAADGRLTVTYRNGAMTSVRIVDGRTGELIREIPVVSE
jgi:hypothetical protein